jgi:hypothetical protein
MNLFKRKPQERPFSNKVAKRVSKIPTADLEMWIDQALTEVGRNLSGYSKSSEKVFLDEALNGAEVLHAVVYEIHKRKTTTL